MEFNQYLKKIADLDFIRRHYIKFSNIRNNDKLIGWIDKISYQIIVSDFHCQLITQNEFFDFGFYRNLVDPKKEMKPFEVIDYYILNDDNNPHPVCEAHFLFLENHPDFDIHFYKLHPDLSLFKASYLIDHYINNGKKENRQTK